MPKTKKPLAPVKAQPKQFRTAVFRRVFDIAETLSANRIAFRVINNPTTGEFLIYIEPGFYQQAQKFFPNIFEPCPSKYGATVSFPYSEIQS